MPKKKKTGNVVVFFTGGTITMKPTARSRGVVPAAVFDKFLKGLKPHLRDVHLDPRRWSELPSPHMTPDHMFRLAKDVDRALAEPDTAGAIVVHGTDVLVESAYMADMLLTSSKPAVFTGAMRYYSETGYDGIRNLLNGLKACLLPMPPETGVVLLMNDRLFSARDVIKINSINVDAFEAPESGPVAYIAGENIQLSRRLYTASPPDRPTIKTQAIKTDVPLVSCFTGMGVESIDAYLDMGVSGMVVEGFGAGNVPPGIVPSLVKAVGDRIPIVITTRCPEGGVSPIYAYPGGGADLANKGIIMGGRLDGPRARIQLMLALGAGMRLTAIRALFKNTF
jgi:L-asparaginase